jgi:hypothetical protein
MVLDFTIPRGDNGEDGQAATISVGTVTTGLPTDPASVTNVGTSSAAVFDFTIPKGDKGDTGATGADATITNVTASVDGNVGTPSVTVTMGGTVSARTFDFAFSNLKGADGASTLSGLTDVNLTTLTNGEALVWDADSQKWVNGNGGVSATYNSGTKTITFA